MKIFFALSTLYLIVSFADCHAQEIISSVESLHGFTGFFVVVEEINPEVERYGLSRQAIQTGVELRLRRNGIKVLTEEDWIKEPSTPMLHVHVAILKESYGRYVYSVDLSVSQNVMLITNLGFNFARTYNPGGILGIAGHRVIRENIRETVFDLMEEFINDWLSVNQ